MTKLQRYFIIKMGSKIQEDLQMCPRQYLRRPNPEGYLTVKEIVNLTQFSAGTVYSWFKDEFLPSTRGLKGEYLVRLKDLKKFLKKYYGMNLNDQEIFEGH